MKKVISVLMISAMVMVTSGCVAVGVVTAGTVGVVYSAYNDALVKVESDMFACYSAVQDVTKELGVQEIDIASVGNTTEANFQFPFQNLEYDITLNYEESNITKIKVSAISNSVVKNKKLATIMLKRIMSKLD